MCSEEEGQAVDIGFWDEMLLMGTSDQLTAEGYKYCVEEPSWRKKQSGADGIEEVWTWLGISTGQDERWLFGQNYNVWEDRGGVNWWEEDPIESGWMTSRTGVVWNYTSW